MINAFLTNGHLKKIWAAENKKRKFFLDQGEQTFPSWEVKKIILFRKCHSSYSELNLLQPEFYRIRYYKIRFLVISGESRGV